jgi:hypothetical protein
LEPDIDGFLLIYLYYSIELQHTAAHFLIRTPKNGLICMGDFLNLLCENNWKQYFHRANSNCTPIGLLRDFEENLIILQK